MENTMMSTKSSEDILSYRTGNAAKVDRLRRSGLYVIDFASRKRRSFGDELHAVGWGGLPVVRVIEEGSRSLGYDLRTVTGIAIFQHLDPFKTKTPCPGRLFGIGSRLKTGRTRSEVLRMVPALANRSVLAKRSPPYDETGEAERSPLVRV